MTYPYYLAVVGTIRQFRQQVFTCHVVGIAIGTPDNTVLRPSVSSLDYRRRLRCVDGVICCSGGDPYKDGARLSSNRYPSKLDGMNLQEPNKQGTTSTWSPGDSAAVLRALASWEAASRGNDDIRIEQLAERMRVGNNDVHQVAKSVEKLVDAGYVKAIEVTSQQSPYKEYIITGLTMAGETASKTSR